MPEAKQPNPDAFGANAWLVDEMFEEFRRDPLSVSESWREFFEGYKPAGANLAGRTVLVPPAQAPVDETMRGAADGGGTRNGAGAGVATLIATSAPPASLPVPGAASSPPGPLSDAKPAPAAPVQAAPVPAAPVPAAPVPAAPVPGGLEGTTVSLRGSAARVVSNMTTSLEVPTATSFRVVPAKLLEVNRLILNNQLARSGTAGKVSFTHLIGWAVVQSVLAVPAINSSFSNPGQQDGDSLAAEKTNAKNTNDKNTNAKSTNSGPAVFRPTHVNLGIAVDLERSDGTRSLMVPVIKLADTLDFRQFWRAYEELVRKVRSGKVEVSDFAGATITITNPGTLGTVQSVPRLMAGQGAIIGVGTIDYPAEWQGADPRRLAELGVSKVVSLSSTYDHRVIQGAESGLFLQRRPQAATRR